MNRWALWAVVVGVCLALCVGVTFLFLERSARRAATDNGAVRDFHKVTVEELDRETRNDLPSGSPRSFVEDWLSNKGMRFSYDPSSQTIVARAPYLKGSGFPVSRSLIFQMHFDDEAKLKLIESKVEATGP